MKIQFYPEFNELYAEFTEYEKEPSLAIKNAEITFEFEDVHAGYFQHNFILFYDLCFLVELYHEMMRDYKQTHNTSWGTFNG